MATHQVTIINTDEVITTLISSDVAPYNRSNDYDISNVIFPESICKAADKKSGIIDREFLPQRMLARAMGSTILPVELDSAAYDAWSVIPVGLAKLTLELPYNLMSYITDLRLRTPRPIETFQKGLLSNGFENYQDIKSVEDLLDNLCEHPLRYTPQDRHPYSQGIEDNGGIFKFQKYEGNKYSMKRIASQMIPEPDMGM